MVSVFDYHFKRQLEAHHFRRSDTPFDFIEIVNYEDGREPKVDSGQVTEEHLSQWLLERSTDSLLPSKCSGGLRILMHQDSTDILYNSTIVDFSKSAFIRIVDAWRLPPAFLQALSKDVGLYTRFERKDPERTEYVMKPLSGIVQYNNGLYTHIHKTGFTYGLLRTNFTNAIPELVSNFQSSKMLGSHPLLFPIVFAEWQLSRLCNMSSKIDADLFGIAEMTGHTVVHDQKSKPKLDIHQDLTNQLSKTSYKIASGQLFSDCLTELCGFIAESLERIKASQRQRTTFLQDDQYIRERLDCITSSAKHARFKFTIYEKRTQFQLSTTYNLIAQQDRILNIEVAKDSKSIALASQRDSASMKTIAVLTTSFLPATWASSFLAMPLFDWSANSGKDVLTNRFWVYWAVTIPLTIVVMAIWWIWIGWRERKNIVEDRRARESGGTASPGKLSAYNHNIPAGVGDMPISSPLSWSKIQDWQDPEQGMAAKEGNARLRLRSL